MRALSLSQAWDDTKAIITRDGRLFASVALALVALPAVIEGLISPRGMDSAAPWWVDAIMIVTSLIALAGQLALIRLALGPSITVGGAIAHGVRRMPIYLLAAILIVIAMFIAAMPFAIVLTLMGVPLPASGVPATPPAVVAALLYLVLICFVAVRMLMSAPVTSAEDVAILKRTLQLIGRHRWLLLFFPVVFLYVVLVVILKRSWDLTAGNWWRLFAFFALFLIAAIALVGGLGAAIGVVVRLLVGPITPLSTGALVVALVQALFNTIVTTCLAVMLARIYVQLSSREDVAEVFR
jgi:hypothetical protein